MSAFDDTHASDATMHNLGMVEQHTRGTAGIAEVNAMPANSNAWMPPAKRDASHDAPIFGPFAHDAANDAKPESNPITDELGLTTAAVDGAWRGGFDANGVKDAAALEMFGGHSGGGGVEGMDHAPAPIRIGAEPSRELSIFNPDEAPKESFGPAKAINGIGSVVSAYEGIKDLVNPNLSAGKRALGGVNGAVGVIGAGSTAASLLGAETGFFGGLATGGAASADALAASTWLGASGAGGGAMAGTMLATGASVIGAGLGAYAATSYGNEKVKDLGWLGKGSDGEERSASDFASDAGTAAHNFVGDNVAGDIVGGLATAGTSVVMAPVAVAGAIAGGISDASDGLANAMSTAQDHRLEAECGTHFTTQRGAAGLAGNVSASEDYHNAMLKFSHGDVNAFAEFQARSNSRAYGKTDDEKAKDLFAHYAG